jgi:hypothetical protein
LSIDVAGSIAVMNRYARFGARNFPRPGEFTRGQPRRSEMTKTWFLALACATSVASPAQAQTSGPAGGGAVAGAGAGTGTSSGGVNGGATGGIIGGGSVVTPPASDSGASGNGSIRPLGR